MSYTIRDLEREIEEKICAYGAESGIDKEELIAEVAGDHSHVEGKDADCALCCVLVTVRERVERAFRKIKKGELWGDEDNGQQTLPGFQHVQARYIVEDDGRLVAINVDRMSSEQMRAKCEQLGRMAAGLIAHRDELRRYAVDRGLGWE